MGRSASSGHVEVRTNSMRIAFVYKGELRRETVRLNGKVMAPTAANQNYARRLSKTVHTEIANDTFDYRKHFPDSPHLPPEEKPGDKTFGALADLWLQSKGKLEDATKDQYGTAVRFWKRMFGEHTSLPALTHQVVEAKIGGYKWPSPKTHNNYMIALRGIFGFEYRGSRAAESPVSEIENMPVIQRLPDPLTRDERDMILGDMRQRYHEFVYAYYLFAFYSGMRPEEMIALRWSDIDFNAGTAKVQRVRTFKGSERDGSKTHAEREVDLVGGALEALKIMAPHTRMLVVEREGDEDTASDIFLNPVTRRPWHDERSQRDHYWKPCLKRLGIRARRSYTTRHTYCTVALMGGVKPVYIAQQAGHSLKMLLEVYARWIPGADGGAERDVLRAAMADFSPQSPRAAGDAANSLIHKGEIGRRDWTRTKKSGSQGE
jgi:integrase